MSKMTRKLNKQEKHLGIQVFSKKPRARVIRPDGYISPLVKPNETLETPHQTPIEHFNALDFLAKNAEQLKADLHNIEKTLAKKESFQPSQYAAIFNHYKCKCGTKTTLFSNFVRLIPDFKDPSITTWQPVDYEPEAYSKITTEQPIKLCLLCCKK
jgi:hypothetical protein